MGVRPWTCNSVRIRGSVGWSGKSSATFLPVAVRKHHWQICLFSMESVLIAAHAVANTSKVAATVTGPEQQVLWFRAQSLKIDIFLPTLSVPLSRQRSSLVVEGRRENGRILWLIPSQSDLLEYVYLGVFNKIFPSQCCTFQTFKIQDSQTPSNCMR